MANPARPRLIVEGSNFDDFSEFLKKIKEKNSNKHEVYDDVFVLPDIEQCEVFYADVVGNEGGVVVSLIFQKMDVYLVGWEMIDDGRRFLFDDIRVEYENILKRKKQELLSRSKPQRQRGGRGGDTAAAATLRNSINNLERFINESLSCHLESDYQFFSKLGFQRPRFELGKGRLKKAANLLPTTLTKSEYSGNYNYHEYKKSIAEAALVFVLSISECLRFCRMLEFMKDNYDNGAGLTPDLSDLLNQWSTKSKEFHNLPNFPTTAELEVCNQVNLVLCKKQQ